MLRSRLSGLLSPLYPQIPGDLDCKFYHSRPGLLVFPDRLWSKPVQVYIHSILHHNGSVVHSHVWQRLPVTALSNRPAIWIQRVPGYVVRSPFCPSVCNSWSAENLFWRMVWIGSKTIDPLYCFALCVPDEERFTLLMLRFYFHTISLFYDDDKSHLKSMQA